MYYFGFGGGPQGKHVVKDSWSGLYGKDSSNNLNTKLYDKLELEKIRGFKFGLSGISPTKRKFSFSRKSFGQFRDLLETPGDTKMVGAQADPEVNGAPVVVTGVNSFNPNAQKSLSDTLRYNQTVGATITKPYIEENYESTPQNLSLIHI